MFSVIGICMLSREGLNYIEKYVKILWQHFATLHKDLRASTDFVSLGSWTCTSEDTEEKVYSLGYIPNHLFLPCTLRITPMVLPLTLSWVRVRSGSDVDSIFLFVCFVFH